MTGISAPHAPNRGKTDDWLTPPDIIEKLGRFDLDPCCPDGPMPWRTADIMLRPTQDGLASKWFGRVWLNPPYGRETGRWLDKLAKHGNGIALTFARTETRFFQRSVFDKATAILFIAGRLYFHHADGERAKHNSGGPSALIAYGESNAKALEVCRISGKFVKVG